MAPVLGTAPFCDASTAWVSWVVHTLIQPVSMGTLPLPYSCVYTAEGHPEKHGAQSTSLTGAFVYQTGAFMYKLLVLHPASPATDGDEQYFCTLQPKQPRSERRLYS